MVSSRREFTRDDSRSLLEELGRRLQAKGVEASLYLVGEAAIALEFDTRRVTGDIDAVFHPDRSVKEEAKGTSWP